MSEYGDECATVARESLRKARKEHKCDACGETITPGRTYHYTFIVFDGEPQTNVRCERCQAMYAHLTARMRADVNGFTEYCNAELNCGHSYEERWDEPPPDEIAALAFWLPGDPLPTAPSKTRVAAPQQPMVTRVGDVQSVSKVEK